MLEFTHKPLRGLIKNKTVLEQAEVSDTARNMLLRKDDPPALDLVGSAYAETFDMSDAESVVKYTTLINKVMAKTIDLTFITRRWVPESQKIVIYCEWVVYKIDATKGS